MVQEREMTQEEEEKYQKNMKTSFDKRHPRGFPSFEEGGYLLVSTGKLGKNPLVRGPFLIKKILWMENFPKTIIYLDDKGTEKVAAAKNAIPYHCRSNACSQGGGK
ncbi:Hypothetical protein NTJ_06442 [Nesidiocoris tenuis]|uniref:Uncharacterized protein n=1 Tax=Nesidiocoris tenuis TaxID=355587 RepID=A0ABN7ANJ0_9HEMI|nr:Hypothetical protein NTJ_06442 [Nesidiocoris tenuis]